MKFNIQKCTVMRVGDTERDLGVITSTDLKVESQCNEACLKANRCWV